MTRSYKKCLITGISGSAGSYLAEHILSKRNKPKIFGFYRSKGHLNKMDHKFKKNIVLFKVDMTNFSFLKKKIKKIKPDIIFHFASNANVRQSFEEPILFAKNNNMITLNLLESVRMLKINPLIVVCSSSEVYGNVKKKNIPINEKQQIAPINPYAATKAFQDLISQIYLKSYGMKIIITRMFSYTNARNEKLFQTSFAKQIINIERKKQKILKHGNLNSIRTFIDKDDAMEAYWTVATKGRIGEIYNLGGDKTISVKKYLKKLIKLSKDKIKCKLDKSLIRPQDIYLQIPNVKKFKKHTGWKKKISFEKSILNLFNECRNIY
jgi:GDP-4-dehydro-6-deoxy-D-mannose reductase